MNLERMTEVQKVQQDLNSILGQWKYSWSEDDYYSLKDTLLDVLSYNMGSDPSDEPPKENPLVAKYLEYFATE